MSDFHARSVLFAPMIFALKLMHSTMQAGSGRMRYVLDQSAAGRESRSQVDQRLDRG